MRPNSENKSARYLVSANPPLQPVAAIGVAGGPENISKNTTVMRPKIQFEYGEPVTVTLRYAQGRAFVSKYYERWPGDTAQVVFSADEGVFYLSDTAGGLLNARLRSMRVDAGDTVTITKLRVPNVNSQRPITEYVPNVETAL